MTARRVSVIGGGPAGLLSAGLLARDQPGWEIKVFERLPPSETFGFGVGLTNALLKTLKQAVPEIHDDLVAASAGFSSVKFLMPQGTAELPHSHAGAIGRSRMLQILLDHAERAGVKVEIGAEPTLGDLRGDADLVIAADGAASASREALAAEIGPSVEMARGLFIWCGAPIRLDGTVFAPVQTDAGTFVAHAYPYAEDLSTFVIETDTETLERAGCRSDEFAGDGDSDDASLAYLSEAFSDLLGGAAFIGNRSRWLHFPTIRCRRWHHDNTVLLGDAAATVHPTLGSGTKVALETAIALAAAIDGVGDELPSSRLDAFERARRPPIERLQERARRSQLWWESFPSRMGLSPARIAAAYMSRAGAVSLEQLSQASPALAKQAVADFAGVAVDEPSGDDLPRWVLGRPLAVNGHELPGRILDADHAGEAREVAVDCGDPWGPDGQAVIDRIAALPRDADSVISLTGGGSRSALLDRLAFAERVRSELGVPVAVASTQGQLGDAVDGIVAGRADLVKIEEGD